MTQDQTSFTPEQLDRIAEKLHQFYETLTEDERNIVMTLFRYGVEDDTVGFATGRQQVTLEEYNRILAKMIAATGRTPRP